MEICKFIEHTFLKPEGTKEDIKKLIDEALKYKFFGVCVNPCFVEYAREIIDGAKKSSNDEGLKLITVINFPLGANEAKTSIFQAVNAISDGADEIDTVISLCDLKEKNYSKLGKDILILKEIIKEKTLKVIIETDLLSKDEIKAACEVCIEGRADFVKTSTGFVKGGVGATVENVKLMHDIVSKAGMKVKASGGIKTYKQALELIEAGASRLGTSSGIDIIKGE